MASSRRGRRGEINIWPAFVDAQAQLVMGIVFILMFFTIAQMLTTDALSGKDAALQKLTQQINELSDILSLERRANSELRLNASQLSAELQNSSAARDALSAQVADLTAKLQEQTARSTQLQSQLANADQSVSADKERIELQLKEIQSIRADIEALRQVRAELERRVAALALQQQQSGQDLTASQNRAGDLETRLAAEQARVKDLEAKLGAATAQQQQSSQELTAVRDRSKQLEARLSTAEERTALAQKDIDQKDVRIKDLLAEAQKAADDLAKERRLSAEAKSQVDALNLQIAALRDQLQKISAALDLQKNITGEQQAQIVDLGKRLNMALANKVEELARYRSEFFGRLRQVLGDRPDIRVVGDRFVFQSEVLFPPGSAELSEEAKRQLALLGNALQELLPKIPNDLNWVLRVDGHTDRRPIATAQFPSNWELSTARAISVVRYLVALGIPADRLAATGFGEFQPLDAGADEAALRRNRRIELKLTER